MVVQKGQFRKSFSAGFAVEFLAVFVVVVAVVFAVSDEFLFGFFVLQVAIKVV